MLPIGEEAEGRRGRPVATAALIAVMVLIGLLTGPGREELRRAAIVAFGLIPARLAASPEEAWWTLLTYQLLHGNILHLATNMLFLWVFGKGLERELRWAYLPFVLLCGVAAGLASVWARDGASTPTVGASGAISGVMGAYLVLLPNHSIRAIVLLPWIWVAAILRGDRPIWDVPAWSAILTWFVLQVVESIGPQAVRSNVDHAAHIGGFLAGYLAVRGLRAGFGLWPDEPTYQRVLDRPTAQGRDLPNSYVRASRLIPVGKPIEAADLEWVDRGSGYVDPDAVPGYDGRALIGRRLREPRYRFEAIRRSDLVPLEEETERAASPT
jgi:membrane associated rhomboid family serine protease